MTGWRVKLLQTLVVRRSHYEYRIPMIAVQRQLAQADAKFRGLLLTGEVDAPATKPTVTAFDAKCSAVYK